MTTIAGHVAVGFLCVGCGRVAPADGDDSCGRCLAAAERRNLAAAELRAWKRYAAGSDFR